MALTALTRAIPTLKWDNLNLDTTQGGAFYVGCYIVNHESRQGLHPLD